MSPHDRVRLQHLVGALNSAIRFEQDRQRSDLDADEMLLLQIQATVPLHHISSLFLLLSLVS